LELLGMEEREHKGSWELGCTEVRPEEPLEDADQLTWDELIRSLL